MYQLRRATAHTFLALLEATLVASLVLVLVAGVALAGKGGPSASTGTIDLVLMDGATAPHYGNRVTFDLATTATVYPWVHLKCSQGGVLVLEDRQGYFSSALGDWWVYLGPSPAWRSGAAECVATLEKSTRKGWSVLASTSFHVEG